VRIAHSYPRSSSITYLLAETQNLEALEVGQVLPAVGLLGLLGEAGLGPLAINLVLGPELLDGAGTGSTGKSGDGEGSESGVGEGKNVTGHDLLLLTGGTVDQDLQAIASQHKNVLQPFRFSIPEISLSGQNRRERFSTYTTVVDNLNNGSELASVGAAADQDEAANLDQLPRSELDIDIGHGGILQTIDLSARSERFSSECTHGRQPGVGDKSGGLLSKESDCPSLRCRISGCAHTLLA